MEDYLQTKIIADENNRKGAVIFKEKKYWKAWFHRGIQRWDPLIYGEEGQNFEEWLYNDESIKFIIVTIPRFGNFQLEMEDFRKFYENNLMIKDTIFSSRRFLFPLKLCKKIEKTKSS